jgi:hypothetical protein
MRESSISTGLDRLAPLGSRRRVVGSYSADNRDGVEVLRFTVTGATGVARAWLALGLRRPASHNLTLLATMDGGSKTMSARLETVRRSFMRSCRSWRYGISRRTLLWR